MFSTHGPRVMERARLLVRMVDRQVEGDEAIAAHYANVAAFAVEFIADLESKPGALSGSWPLLQVWQKPRL